MKPFNVTLKGRKDGEPDARAVRVTASDSRKASRIAEIRTGGRAVACKCLWETHALNMG